jgi:RsmE family RNA methyltransferase
LNVVLFEPSDVDADGVATLDRRRAQHLHDVLGKGVGDTLRVGVLGGKLGAGRLLAPDRVACTFTQDPPPKRPVTVVVALPRPPMLRRMLQHATAMGVTRIVLLHARRVEKSFWTAKALADAAIREQLLLGLEQAVDTILPTVERAPKFRPFVEDRLPDLVAGGPAYVADPGATGPCPVDAEGAVTVVIGPEGGFIPFELDLLRDAGCVPVSLGRRLLRVEAAVVAILARLGPG